VLRFNAEPDVALDSPLKLLSPHLAIVALICHKSDMI